MIIEVFGTFISVSKILKINRYLEAVVAKKVLLKISQNSLETTCARASLSPVIEFLKHKMGEKCFNYKRNVSITLNDDNLISKRYFL